MLLIYTFAGLSLVAFLSALFMGVTVVGVCRYGAQYSRFFERLKDSGLLLPPCRRQAELQDANHATQIGSHICSTI
jgi:hypothetical protein